jgi:hypothetical protein
MQDFAPFIPELLGTLSGPQTPFRKATSAPDSYTDLSTLHFGVATRGGSRICG